MPFTVLLCTDGSELAESALADGLAVVGPPDRVVVATAVEPVDPTLAVGTGLAGGVISPTEAQPEHDERTAAAQRLLERCWDRSPTTWCATHHARW